MIAIIDPNGTITIHPIEYSAWLSLADVSPPPPGTVVIGPGLGGIITITPKPVERDDAPDPDHDGDWGYDVKPEPEPVRRCGYCRGSLVLPGAYCSDSCEGLDKDRRDPRPASTIAADSGAPPTPCDVCNRVGHHAQGVCVECDEEFGEPSPIFLVPPPSVLNGPPVKKPRKVKATAKPEHVEAVVATLAAVPAQLVGEIAIRTAIHPHDVNACLSVLRDSGKVTSKGKARGTRYSLASDTVDAYGDE